MIIIKCNKDRSIFVVKRYSKKKVLTFNEIFISVVKLIRVVLTMRDAFVLHIKQLDVKTTFF